ncbi:MAG: phosphoserine phosphatase SerB [Rhodobiaceae bacterium]|nr:phosphoserine phosphatase SerB [Rhodobiaceae bacterium]
MESALTTAPPSASATASASADLPLAVGPAIRTAAGRILLPVLSSMPAATSPNARPMQASSRPNVATLVVPAGETTALADARRALAALLPGAGDPEPLGAHALDLPFADANLAKLRRAALDTIGDLPADLFVQPAATRRKRLLIADMDSTIIGQECIDELADVVGIRAEISAVTERAMRGEIAFEPALRERVALLKGVSLASVQRLLDEVITLNPGARALATTMAANGAHTALVSGGFTLFTSVVAGGAGFAENRANVLEMTGDELAGVVREPILGREAKQQALEEMAAQRSIPLEVTLAVGDGANDLAMIERAGLGVAYRAKPVVAAAADAHVAHADLTALLYAQGYRETDILPDRPA